MTNSYATTIGAGLMWTICLLVAAPEASAQGSQATPPGSIVAWLGDSRVPPDGWLIADGASLDAANPANRALCAVLGDRFRLETDPNGVCRLPYLSGRMLVAAGRYRGSEDRERDFAIGSFGGETRHTLTVAEMPSHAHEMNDYLHGNPGAPSHVIGQGGYGVDYNSRQPTRNAGGGEPHNNLPPYFAVVFLVKR